MKIQDYETGRQLKDVNIELTTGEAEELLAYLKRMLDRDDLTAVHLTDLKGGVIESELSLSLSNSALVA